MLTLDLVRITDTSGRVTGEKGKITYQALGDDDLDDLYCMESDYSYIGREFNVEKIGNVQIPSINPEDEGDEVA